MAFDAAEANHWMTLSLEIESARPNGISWFLIED
jgi:hypothetical protein